MTPSDPTRRVRLRVPALPSLIAPIRSILSEALERWLGEELSREACDEFLVAVQEALTNVIRHGYGEVPGPVEVELRLGPSGEEAQALLRDQGRPFDPARVPPPDFGRPRPGGYGLHIIRSFTDACTFGRRSGTNWVRMSRRVRVACEARVEGP